MAKYLKESFGCYNALFLDAGASSAMVYSWKVLAQGNRSIITDAFVVVDRDTFLKLWWNPNRNYHPYIPEYTITPDDEKVANKLKKAIDAVYAKYGKSKYKNELISLFRWLIKDSLPDSKKAIYNEVLIYLFTIWEL